MNTNTYRSIVSVLALGALLLGAHKPATAQQLSMPPIGGWDVQNGVVFNVYWDPLWDEDNTGDMSQATLDKFTQALCRSTYFSGLAQYNVNQPRFVGSLPQSTFLQTFAIPPPQPSPAWKVTTDTLGQFLDWLSNQGLLPAVQNNQNLVVNIFLPPGVTEVDMSDGTVIAPGSIFAAFHDYHGSIPFTVLPASVLPTLGQVTPLLSHEMVEALTDPNPGWGFAAERGFLGFGESAEAADLAEADSFTPFLNGQVEQYWSNQALNGVGGPIQGFTNVTPPTFNLINPVTTSGSGANLQLTLQGSGFGPVPFDLGALPANSQNTLYFQLQDITQNWLAGGISDTGTPDTSPLNYLSWSNTGIKFNMAPVNEPFSPADLIIATVWNPANGQQGVISVLTNPVPYTLSLNSQPNSLDAGGTVLISGSVWDQYGYALPNVAVNLTATGGVIDNPNPVTASNGTFSANFTVQTAGRQVVTANVAGSTTATSASTIVNALPVVHTVTPDHGTVAGGSPARVTITGKGFAMSDQVTFGNSAPATVLSVSPTGDSITVAPPADPLPGNGIGRVDVIVNAQGLVSHSSDLFYYFNAQGSLVQGSDLFYYYQPFEPILYGSFISPAINSMPVIAQFWDASGNAWTGASANNITFTTSHGALTGQAVVGGQITTTLSDPGPATDKVTVTDSQHPACANSESVQFVSAALAQLVQSVAGRIDISNWLRRYPNWQPYLGLQPASWQDSINESQLTTSISGAQVLLSGQVAPLNGNSSPVSLNISTPNSAVAHEIAPGLQAFALSRTQTASLRASSLAHYVASGPTMVHAATPAGPVINFTATGAAAALFTKPQSVRMVLPISATKLPAGYRLDVYRLDTTFQPALWSNAGISVEAVTPTQIMALVPGPGVYTTIAVKASEGAAIAVSAGAPTNIPGMSGLVSVVQAVVRDRQGHPMAGVPVFFCSDYGAFTSAAPVITGTNGRAINYLPGASAGVARVTAVTVGLSAATFLRR